jgi:N6-adenosine-specific RNA methylase IME4
MPDGILIPHPEPFSALPADKRYCFVSADPPWRFRNRSPKGEGKNAVRHYQCMPLAEIQALPVSRLVAPDAACIMWATAPMLPQAIDTLEAWGFTYKSAGSWAKQSKTGARWAFGTGYCYRNAAEFWLLGTIGRPILRSHSIRNLIVAPIAEHSKKPSQMHDDIEAMYDGPYLELFARRSREGWDVWGDEAAENAPLSFSAPTRSPV